MANSQLRELALFAGAGGGILGGHLLGWTTICAVEHDPHCIAVLAQRQNDGILAPFPIWDDVRTFDGKVWCGVVDVVSAGFPCQPFSIAGRRKGEGDERNLWPETIRIIREVRPQFAFLENVPGLLSVADADGRRYFGRILSDLAEAGYDAEWTVLGAGDIGAPHERKRLWIYASDADSNGPQSGEHEGYQAEWKSGEFERLVHEALQHAVPAGRYSRMASRDADRIHRLRATGNGQVPAVAAAAWRILTDELPRLHRPR